MAFLTIDYYLKDIETIQRITINNQNSSKEELIEQVANQILDNSSYFVIWDEEKKTIIKKSEVSQWMLY